MYQVTHSSPPQKKKKKKKIPLVQFSVSGV